MKKHIFLFAAIIFLCQATHASNEIKSAFEKLPTEIIIKIFEDISSSDEDLYALFLCCKTFYNIIKPEKKLYKKIKYLDVKDIIHNLTGFTNSTKKKIRTFLKIIYSRVPLDNCNQGLETIFSDYKGPILHPFDLLCSNIHPTNSHFKDWIQYEIDEENGKIYKNNWVEINKELLYTIDFNALKNSPYTEILDLYYAFAYLCAQKKDKYRYLEESRLNTKIINFDNPITNFLATLFFTPNKDSRLQELFQFFTLEQFPKPQYILTCMQVLHALINKINKENIRLTDEQNHILGRYLQLLLMETDCDWTNNTKGSDYPHTFFTNIIRTYTLIPTLAKLYILAMDKNIIFEENVDLIQKILLLSARCFPEEFLKTYTKTIANFDNSFLKKINSYAVIGLFEGFLRPIILYLDETINPRHCCDYIPGVAVYTEDKPVNWKHIKYPRIFSNLKFWDIITKQILLNNGSFSEITNQIIESYIEEIKHPHAYHKYIQKDMMLSESIKHIEQKYITYLNTITIPYFKDITMQKKVPLPKLHGFYGDPNNHTDREREINRTYKNRQKIIDLYQIDQNITVQNIFFFLKQLQNKKVSKINFKKEYQPEKNMPTFSSTDFAILYNNFFVIHERSYLLNLITYFEEMFIKILDIQSYSHQEIICESLQEYLEYIQNDQPIFNDLYEYLQTQKMNNHTSIFDTYYCKHIPYTTTSSKDYFSFLCASIMSKMKMQMRNESRNYRYDSSKGYSIHDTLYWSAEYTRNYTFNIKNYENYAKNYSQHKYAEYPYLVDTPMDSFYYENCIFIPAEQPLIYKKSLIEKMTDVIEKTVPDTSTIKKSAQHFITNYAYKTIRSLQKQALSRKKFKIERVKKDRKRNNTYTPNKNNNWSIFENHYAQSKPIQALLKN